MTNYYFKSAMGQRGPHCSGQRFAGVRKLWLAMAVFFWVGAFGLSSAQAATLCVDPLGVPAPGAGECYALPSQAVAAAANGDTILIHSGTYMESVTINITQTNLKIIGDNPANTAVKNSVLADVFTLPSGSSAEIANLAITGGGNGIGGIYGTGTIHHNRIEFNGGLGIYLNICTAFNNIIRNNGDHGVLSQSNDASNIFNNVVTENGGYGIYNGTASYNSSYNNGASGTLNFVSTSGNIGNISSNCLFVDAAAGDFRLAGSPCRDTGNPGYLDVDGTVSDMGIFGGPASALFWPYGNGGPVVTGLTVTPSHIPEGGTLSIKATVEIR